MPASPPPDLLGAALGPYRITREIGRGGMAIVYEAYQPSLNRTVAIKVLPQQYTFDHEFVARFLQEARNAAQLSHPNIVPIYDVGQQDGWYYIVMQHLAGEPLNMLIAREGSLPLARATRIAEQVASALDYAHGRGIIHRDIKPANIIVGPGDIATLTDFGLAKAAEAAALTRSGSIVGTPEYMSPEQAQGLPATAASDRYALGIVLYQMLAGRLPFFADTIPSLLFKQVYEPPPPLRSLAPDLPTGIDAILARALAKKPGERYSSAQEMAAALSALRTARPGRGRAAALPAPTRPGPAQLATPPPSDPDAETRLLAAPAPATPAGVPDATQRRSRGWHLPALIAAAAVASLALASLFWPAWFPPRDRAAGRPVPAATSTAQMAVPAAPTSTPIVVAADTPVKTVTQPVAPTAIPTGVPPTAAPRPTDAPVKTVTQPLAPTAIPTDVPPTAAPRPTDTPRPSASATPTPLARPSNTAAPAPPTATERPPLPPVDLAFVGVYQDANSREVFVMYEGNPAPRRLTAATGNDGYPAVSPGRTLIAFEAARDAPKSDIWIMNSDGSSQRRLTTDPAVDAQPAFSPDGGRIAFISDRTGEIQIHTMRVDGSDVRHLPAPGACFAPSYSPDGGQIVFVATQDSVVFHVYVMNTDGSGRRQITTQPAHYEHPSFSADGRFLIAQSDAFGPGEIVRIGIDGGGVTNLTRNPAPDSEPAWSWDGRRIAFTRTETSGMPHIWLMDQDGGNQHQLTDLGLIGEFQPGWAR